MATFAIVNHAFVMQQSTGANRESLIQQRPERTCSGQAQDKFHVGSLVMFIALILQHYVCIVKTDEPPHLDHLEGMEKSPLTRRGQTRQELEKASGAHIWVELRDLGIPE